MKFIALLLLLMSMTFSLKATVFDNFNRGDGSLGANWTAQNGGETIVSQAVKGTNAADFTGSFWSANSFNNAQSSSGTLGVSNTYTGPTVRASGTGAGAYNFYIYFSHGSFQKLVNGAQTIIAAVTAGSVGDKMKITVDGTSNFTLEINGASAGSVPGDSTLATGSAGIGSYSNTATLDDWYGTGEIAAGGATPFLPTPYPFVRR